MLNGRKDLKHILKKIYNHESLAGVDLRNLYLSCTNFSGLELCRADLEGCCLSHARLNRAKLTGAILANVVADGASFEDTLGLTASSKKYLKSRGATGL